MAFLLRCISLVRKWHFSSNRCNAQFRELSEVQRTCHEPVGRLDPTLLTQTGS
jgi:hypothetical protein